MAAGSLGRRPRRLPRRVRQVSVRGLRCWYSWISLHFAGVADHSADTRHLVRRLHACSVTSATHKPQAIPQPTARVVWITVSVKQTGHGHCPLRARKAALSKSGAPRLNTCCGNNAAQPTIIAASPCCGLASTGDGTPTAFPPHSMQGAVSCQSGVVSNKLHLLRSGLQRRQNVCANGRAPFRGGLKEIGYFVRRVEMRLHPTSSSG